MSRLNMRQCRVCKEETIHKGARGGTVCIYCDTAYIEPADLNLDPRTAYMRRHGVDMGQWGSALQKRKAVAQAKKNNRACMNAPRIESGD